MFHDPDRPPCVGLEKFAHLLNHGRNGGQVQLMAEEEQLIGPAGVAALWLCKSAAMNSRIHCRILSMHNLEATAWLRGSGPFATSTGTLEPIRVRP
jgi:hypothetical protein